MTAGYDKYIIQTAVEASESKQEERVQVNRWCCWGLEYFKQCSGDVQYSSQHAVRPHRTTESRLKLAAVAT